MVILLVERLQDHPEWKHIPVIVVTAKDLSRDEHEFLYSRVSQVVQKGSIDPDDLGETLRDTLRRYQK